MIAELLATLAGHPSSLFSSTSQSFSGHASLRARDDLDFLHPSDIHILNHLAYFSSRYVRIKNFADTELERARQNAVRAALKANSLSRGQTSDGQEVQQQVTIHLVPLCATLLSILREYHELVLQTERDVLANRTDLVGNAGFVSLANLRARFECWDSPLTALDDLVTNLLHGPIKADATSESAQEASLQPKVPSTWTGGLLIDLLSLKASTGVRRVAEHMARLRNAVEDSWMNGLIAWVCRGEIYRPGSIADPHSSKRAPVTKDQLVHWVDQDQQSNTFANINDGLEDWAANSGSTWAIQKNALPQSVSDATADSILYVGRALYTIRNSTFSNAESRMSRAWNESGQQQGPPESMIQQHQKLLQQHAVRPSRSSELDRAVQTIRNDVSEWIFRNILTTNLVLKSLHTLGDYFLHRNGPFALSLLGEVEKMRKKKLFQARSAAAGTIRVNDLEISLHRATVGTSAEDDPALNRLRFVLPKGGFRPSLPTGRAAKVRDAGDVSKAPSTTPARFDDLLIGVPAQLYYTALFPLDLFLSPSDLTAYSRIFSYLMAIKKIHQRVLECWTGLGSNQRQRRKFTGTGEGGVDKREEQQREQLLRRSCNLVRTMLWFLDTLLGHFQTDIIDDQYMRLLEQLQFRSSNPRLGPRVSTPVGVPMSRSVSALGVRDRTESLQRSSSPARSAYGAHLTRPRTASGSTMGVSRISTVGFPSSGSRKLAFPVSGPALSASQSVGRSAGRRFPSAPSLRKDMDAAPSAAMSILDIADTHSGNGDLDDEEAELDGEQDTGVLDFASLRAAHISFIAYVQDGLLLSSPSATSIVRAVLDTCDRFAGSIERWGGDVLPSLLSDTARDESTGQGDQHLQAIIQDRQLAVDDTSADLSLRVNQFFQLLSSLSIGTAMSQPPVNQVDDTASLPLSPLPSQLPSSTPTIPTAGLDAARTNPVSTAPSSIAARKHLEQLLLRLDYSGYFERQQHADRQQRQDEQQQRLARPF